MSNKHNKLVAVKPQTIDAISAMLMAYGRIKPKGLTARDILRFQKVDDSFSRVAIQASLVQLLQPRYSKSNVASGVLKTSDKPNIAGVVHRLVESEYVPQHAVPLNTIPSWDRRTHTLSFGPYEFVFKSSAVNVVSILNAFEQNRWEPIEEILRWMPIKKQLSRTTGKMPDKLDNVTLADFEVRDALTVLKNKTKRLIGWHRKGCGVSWERLV